MAPKHPNVLDDGITELWAPEKPDDAVADVLFVHGLMGNAYKTWLYGSPATQSSASKESTRKKLLGWRKSSKVKSDDTQTSSENDSCYWPYDLVAKDFPNVRVLTYGYDSYPSHFYQESTNQMTITQHSRNLLEQITDFRATCRGRPIIFVAHSLGGILIKDAIIESLKYEEQLDMKDLGLSCRAIVFFGTPHFGATIAQYGEMIAALVGSLPGGFSFYGEVLHGLRPDSEKLDSVNRDFARLLNRSNIPAKDKIQLYSFQEGKPLTSVKLFDGKIVPPHSSYFNREDIERSSVILENHMDMCRFRSASSRPYSAFKAALTRYIGNIKTQPSEDQDEPDDQHAEEREEWLRRVDFQERVVRQQQLDSEYTMNISFEWLWSSSFVPWLEGDRPLFWISGKPASGKSTLMNHIRNTSRALDLLKAAHDTDWTCIHFFFDFRAGSGIANNFEGFLRSLLAQLVRNIPSLYRAVERYSERQRNDPFLGLENLSLGLLRRAFDTALKNLDTPLLILLDGLDEYEGERVELVAFINTICSKKVKVCLASRPESPFPVAFGEAPTFAMQDVNREGISAFVRATTEKFFSQSITDNSLKIKQLVDYITDNAWGVFLWARFAVFELISCTARGEPVGFQNLQKALNQLPRNLEDIYSRIILRTPQATRDLTAAILLLVTSTASPALSFRLLYEVVSWVSWEAYGIQIRKSDLLPNDLEHFRRYSLEVTGGLIECISSNAKKALFPDHIRTTPRLIHRSVQSYLDSKGWIQLLQNRYVPHLGAQIWLDACTLKWLNASIDISRDNSEFNSLFSSYVKDGYSGDEIINEFEQLFECFISPSLYEYKSLGRFHLRHGSWNLTFGLCNGMGLEVEELFSVHSVLYLPTYAWRFEKLSKGSCYYTLLKLRPTFYWKWHLILIRAIDAVRCDCRSANSAAGLIDLLGEDQCFDISASAIMHRLTLCVRDSLSVVQLERPLLKTWKSFFSRATLKTLRNSIWTAQGMQELALWGIDWTAEGENAPQARLVLEEVLRFSYRTEDEALAYALVSHDLDVIHCLLRKYEPGKIRLKSTKELFHGQNITSASLRRKGKQEMEFGPLWAIGFRSGWSGKLVEEVADLFLERGECINELCSPYGTIIHSYFVICDRLETYTETAKFLKAMLTRGVNINLQSAWGTALDLVWRKVHVERWQFQDFDKGRKADLRCLIEHGARSSQRDPNGLIPSQERILNFPTTRNEYVEYVRYYYCGPDGDESTSPEFCAFLEDGSYMMLDELSAKDEF